MNFYIGCTITDIDIKDVNVEFSDELLDYIYKIRNEIEIDTSRLYEINPYKDVILLKKNYYR